MHYCRETTKMGVQPGNRRVLVPRRTCTVRRRGSLSCLSRLSRACLGERSLGEPVEGTPEDARKGGYIRGRRK